MEPENQKKPVVAIYCRISTSQQDFEMQMHELNSEVEKIGACALYTYTDTVGGATQVSERKYAEDVVQDAREGKFQTLLVWRIDRIARDEEYGLNYLRRIEETGCRIRFLSNTGIDTPVPYTEQAASIIKTMRVMLLMGARMEHEAIKARTKAAKLRWIKSNKWAAVAHVPLGYKINKDYGLDVDPVGALLVKRIYSLYIDENMSSRQITKLLNDEGIRSSKGGMWCKDSVQKILRNPIYTGKLAINGAKLGSIHTFTCTPIISDERFAEAQQKKCERLARSARNIKYEYPFRPYLSCAVCGYDLHSIISRRSDKNNGFSISYGFRKPAVEVKYKKRCPEGCGRISELKLVEAIYKHVLGFINRASIEEIQEWLENPTKVQASSVEEQLTALNTQLNRVQSEIDRIYDMYQDGRLTKENMRHRIDGVGVRQKAVEEKIRLLKQKEVSKEEGRERLERLESLAWDLKTAKWWANLRMDTELEDTYQTKRHVAINFLNFVKSIRVSFLEDRLYITTKTPKYSDGTITYESVPVVKRGRPKLSYGPDNSLIAVTQANSSNH